MVEAGAAVQAMQLAETPPNLLDLVTLVEFHQAEKWRHFCLTKKLLLTEKLSARDVSVLNECYNCGISSEHPVYAAYRDAMLTRNDTAALLVLKSIARLNPTDENAYAELARLDAKVLLARMNKLDGLLNTDPVAAIHELESIEAFGFKSKLSGDVWRRGQSVRSGQLLTDAEGMKERCALAEVVTLLDFLAQLRSDHDLKWTPDWEERVLALKGWCQTEALARRLTEDFNTSLRQLSLKIMLSEEKDTRAQKVTLMELKADQEDMHYHYRQVERFSRSIPEELSQRFQKRTILLQQKIQRLTTFRTALRAAVAGTVVLVLLGLGLAFIGLQRANALTAEMKKAIEARQVRIVETQIKLSSSKTILSTPRFKSTCTMAASMVARELALLGEFETAFKKLPAQLNSVVSTDQFLDINGFFKLAEQAHLKLSPDLLAETQPLLAGFRERWKGHYVRRLPALNQELNEQISAAEASAAVLNQTPDLERFRAIIEAVLPKMEQASQRVASLGIFVKLSPELPERCQMLMERLRKDKSALVRLDDSLAALARAEKPADVADVVVKLSTVEIRQSDYARVARKTVRALMALKDDPDALSRALLVGTNASLLNSMFDVQNLNFTPKKVSIKVRGNFMDLARDFSVVGKHHRTRLQRDKGFPSYEEWITDGPLMNNDMWQTIQGWVVQDQGPCKFSPQEYGAFKGSYRFLPVNKPVQGVQVVDITALTAVWMESGFAALVDMRNQAYKLPPLKVVDGIIAATNSSAIMRAFLLNELLEYMASEPLESGLLFSPKLRSMPERLQALGVEEIRIGDWFVPSRVRSLERKFEEFFASFQGISFFKQTSGIVKATTRAAKSGFALVGHARPDGAPTWKSFPEGGFVWGLPEVGDLPTLLFIVRGSEVRKITNPLPLTPLLVYQGDLTAVINESGVRADDPSLKGQLPPLFTIPVATP